ncbi:hypothetical protein [Rhodalgimonas zhirmunskyi]|nr:hypothetical protein [Rhodoalgimonas zhirmunskyi]
MTASGLSDLQGDTSDFTITAQLSAADLTGYLTGSGGNPGALTGVLANGDFTVSSYQFALAAPEVGMPGADPKADPIYGYTALGDLIPEGTGKETGLESGQESASQHLINVAGTQYILLADPDISSLSVYTVQDGQPDTMTDQVIDTLQTRFSGVSAIDYMPVENHGLIAAAGLDDGFSVFSLTADGALHHVETQEGSWEKPLNGITGIAMDLTGETLTVSVTREQAPGSTAVELSLPADLLPESGRVELFEDTTPPAPVDMLYTLGDGNQPVSDRGEAGAPVSEGEELDWHGTAMNWVPAPDGVGMVLEFTSHEQDFVFHDSTTLTHQEGAGSMMEDGTLPLQIYEPGQGAGAFLDDLFEDTTGAASWIVEAQMFATGQDMVRIIGFKAEGESASIDLSRLGGFEQTSDVLEAATQVADGVLIEAGLERSILIEGVDLAELTETDFVI